MAKPQRQHADLRPCSALPCPAIALPYTVTGPILPYPCPCPCPATMCPALLSPPSSLQAPCYLTGRTASKHCFDPALQRTSVLGWHAGIKYTVRVHRRASDTFSLSLGSSSVDAVIRTLNDGGLLVQASPFSSLAHPPCTQYTLYIHACTGEGQTQVRSLPDMLC